MTKSKKIFAGLTTGVKLEKHSRSILKQVLAFDDGPERYFALKESIHIGIEPMLLALSMELALKAWYVWDHDRHDPIRSHDLLKLYEALSVSTKKKLNARYKEEVGPYQPWGDVMDYNISDLLAAHKDAFVKWRYLHEPRDGGIGFEHTAFVATLELVLDEFGKLYETVEFNPRGSHPNQ